MVIRVNCDKCGAEIDGDFARVFSLFYTVNQKPFDTEIISECADGDEFILCDKCYSQLIKVVE